MIAAALALLLGAAPAAAPSQDAQAVAALGTGLSARGMSPAGVAKAQASMRTTIAKLQAMVPRAQASTGALRRLALAEPFNAAAFEAALRANIANANAIRDTQVQSQLALFHALSPADQKVFARAGAGGPPPGQTPRKR